MNICKDNFEVFWMFLDFHEWQYNWYKCLNTVEEGKENIYWENIFNLMVN